LVFKLKIKIRTIIKSLGIKLYLGIGIEGEKKIK
jgi:hypothetical protein